MKLSKLSLNVRMTAQVYEMSCCNFGIGLLDVCIFQNVSKPTASRIMQHLVMMGYAVKTVSAYRSNSNVFTFHITESASSMATASSAKADWQRVIENALQERHAVIMAVPRMKRMR